ncbi:hypothetical protein AB6E94_18895 [Vibrio lentus]|uniref:hypothetical protein n=1 Tax=Vibrio splendidus TaxID=29497 RepID=UPI000C836799|nr:hypothetical protein [Vibrio splendidus]PMG17949.1 hypothetical protein BCU98_01025 [Vibrio splendidus]
MFENFISSHPMYLEPLISLGFTCKRSNENDSLYTLTKGELVISCSIGSENLTFELKGSIKGGENDFAQVAENLAHVVNNF